MRLSQYPNFDRRQCLVLRASRADHLDRYAGGRADQREHSTGSTPTAAPTTTAPRHNLVTIIDQPSIRSALRIRSDRQPRQREHDLLIPGVAPQADELADDGCRRRQLVAGRHHDERDARSPAGVYPDRKTLLGRERDHYPAGFHQHQFRRHQLVPGYSVKYGDNNYHPFTRGSVIGGQGVGARPDLGFPNSFAAQAFIAGSASDWRTAKIYSTVASTYLYGTLLDEASGRIAVMNNGPPTGPGGNGTWNSNPASPPPYAGLSIPRTTYQQYDPSVDFVYPRQGVVGETTTTCRTRTPGSGPASPMARWITKAIFRASPMPFSVRAIGSTN